MLLLELKGLQSVDFLQDGDCLVVQRRAVASIELLVRASDEDVFLVCEPLLMIVAKAASLSTHSA